MLRTTNEEIKTMENLKITNEDAENKHVYFNPKNKWASFSRKKLAIGQIFWVEV